MSPTVTTVNHHRMLRTASHLVDHPAIVSVYFGDDDTVEAVTAAGRTIRLQPDPLEPDKARATRASMTVIGVPGEMTWPTFEVLVDASKGSRLVNRVLRRAVIIQNARVIPVGSTTLAGLLAPDRQHHHARDHFGHPGPMQNPSLRLAFPRPGADPRTGAPAPASTCCSRPMAPSHATAPRIPTRRSPRRGWR